MLAISAGNRLHFILCIMYAHAKYPRVLNDTHTAHFAPDAYPLSTTKLIFPDRGFEISIYARKLVRYVI